MSVYLNPEILVKKMAEKKSATLPLQRNGKYDPPQRINPIST